jgi:hypothetical protein
MNIAGFFFPILPSTWQGPKEDHKRKTVRFSSSVFCFRLFFFVEKNLAALSETRSCQIASGNQEWKKKALGVLIGCFFHQPLNALYRYLKTRPLFPPIDLLRQREHRLLLSQKTD